MIWVLVGQKVETKGTKRVWAHPQWYEHALLCSAVEGWVPRHPQDTGWDEKAVQMDQGEADFLRLIHEKEIKDLERIELRESLDIHGSFEWPVAFPATGNAWVSRASPKFSKDNGKVIPDNTIAENFNKDRKVSLKNEWLCHLHWRERAWWWGQLPLQFHVFWSDLQTGHKPKSLLYNDNEWWPMTFEDQHMAWPYDSSDWLRRWDDMMVTAEAARKWPCPEYINSTDLPLLAAVDPWYVKEILHCSQFVTSYETKKNTDCYNTVKLSVSFQTTHPLIPPVTILTFQTIIITITNQSV